MNSLSLYQKLIELRYNYPSQAERQRASLFLALLGGALIVGIILILRTGLLPIIEGREIDVFEFVTSLPVFLSFGLIYLIQTGRLRLASVIAVTALSLNSIVVLFNLRVMETPLFVFILMPLSLAVLVFDRRYFNITAVLLVAAVLVMDTIQSGSLGGFLSNVESAFAFFVFILTVVLLSASSNSLRNIALENISEIDHYHTVAGFTESLSVTSDNRVLSRMIEVIRSEMRYAFSQVFLVDEGGQMTRRFRTGLNLPEGGVVTDVRLPDASALFQAYQSNSVITISTQENPARWEHFLPASNYGLAIPLKIDGQVIGVVDIQKTETPFNVTEISALERLVGQAGTLLAYSRTVEDLRSSLDNLQATSESLRGQLRELKQTERDVISATWESYLDIRSRQAIGYDLQPEGITLAVDMSDDILDVMQRGDVLVDDDEDTRFVRVPIIIRGEVLGAMAFKVPQSQPFGARQIDFARSVTVRLGLALENKRLLEASRAQATRERKAGEVATTLIGATNVNDVVKLAAESFNNALGAVATRIILDRKLLDEDLLDTLSSGIGTSVATPEEEATS